MSLSHTAVTSSKPKDKMYKLFDGGGLYLQVKPSGYKCWKYDYRIDKTRGTYTIGQYPDISLKEARSYHRDARTLVAKNVNPKLIKEQERIKGDLENKRFSHYSNQWLEKQNLATSTYSDLKQRIEKNLNPFLDKKKVNEFSTSDLFKIVLKMSDRGAKETAQRMANVLRRIYNEILILGVVENNPAQGLAELLPKPDVRLKENFGHVTTTIELANLLREIDKPRPKQDFATTQALKLMPLVFLRPKNIRFLKWDYIDFKNKIINLPASELKTRKALSVPLSQQSLKILKDIKPLTGDGTFVFVTANSQDKPLSESTTTEAIKRLINPITSKPFGTGYMTSHGFRHTASTMLNELGFDPDIIELQLAHINKDRIRATYNKAEWMDKRIAMMQSWANYLDGLKSGADVVPINKK
ncbi:MAG: integrase [Gammaproteobacteria bacterium]|nr:MAG: integrase [Gammaproteobacteria bacterium]